MGGAMQASLLKLHRYLGGYDGESVVQTLALCQIHYHITSSITTFEITSSITTFEITWDVGPRYWIPPPTNVCCIQAGHADLVGHNQCWLVLGGF